ncbi:MAG: hypothetical protein A2233_00735 [Candidatus Kerfeldbacteria bacterium RIFOXYA2_FULL_38_24]|uniref:Lysine transporter LysE n=1 Tax=Candidatus Kerfeldbacteria bacterium RIFOXYB2_FULL_38_14 TaxID=1798547 RepID=A0A1G2BIG6_9BACT|nr:MAG: hypothetical protein A2233_00735 [Candidatus Kerfeldbacteria bacterium RIFOXYA2_FULL_38_24]OGY88080.1 MAG: hypothetical protein A2319_01465 [Candidatus Kerfeldbacteria bacterium RIFOXYB2_FULL_38_14]OGY88438.1 MAG: hypothetical protein A2458_02340 [Candidatus Kerfeldbacteria bacterium RIFOXYC2_FULL_38_9]
MPTYLSLFIIGFTAAALPGAVQTTVFSATLRGKIMSGIKVALGAACMNGTYFFLSYYGITEIITHYTIAKLIIGAVGFLYILWLGVGGLKDTIKKRETAKTKKSAGFFSGILLVALHIPTLIYFLSIAGSFYQEKTSLFFVFFSAISLAIGTVSCFMIISLLAIISNKYGKDKAVYYLQIVSALLLIIFSFKLLFDLIKII